MQEFYADKVQHLKKSDTRSWWKLAKQISGQSNSIAPIHIEKNGVSFGEFQLASALKSKRILHRSECRYSCFRYERVTSFFASRWTSTGDPTTPNERICSWSIAEPTTDLFNLSFFYGVDPDIWKCALEVCEYNSYPAIPKEKLPILGDLRAISFISKVMEEWILIKNIAQINSIISSSALQ